MKLQLHLLAWLLATFMVLAYAAPDKAPTENHPAADYQEDPIGKFAAPGEEAVGDLLLQAMSLLGVAYRFGGSSPSTGLDCSGFIQYVFKKSLRVNLPRTAAEMANTGRSVEKSELAPGDLVFFNTRGFQYSHVGIYMGGGKFIHSPRTGKSVEVSNMNQNYWTARYNGARRVSRGSSSTFVREDSEPTPRLARSAIKAAPEAKKDVAAASCRKGRRCKPEEAAEPAKEAKSKVTCRKGRRCKPEEAAAPAKGKAASAKSGKSSRAKEAQDKTPARRKSSGTGKPGKEAHKKKAAASRHS